MENVFKVPKKQWSKWDDDAQDVFNRTYLEMTSVGPECLTAPTTNLSEKEMDVIAWNASWLAADSVMGKN